MGCQAVIFLRLYCRTFSHMPNVCNTGSEIARIEFAYPVLLLVRFRFYDAFNLPDDQSHAYLVKSSGSQI
jgi:hypothetical protein